MSELSRFWLVMLLSWIMIFLVGLAHNLIAPMPQGVGESLLILWLVSSALFILGDIE